MDEELVPSCVRDLVAQFQDCQVSRAFQTESLGYLLLATVNSLWLLP